MPARSRVVTVERNEGKKAFVLCHFRHSARAVDSSVSVDVALNERIFFYLPVLRYEVFRFFDSSRDDARDVSRCRFTIAMHPDDLAFRFF